MLRHSRNSPSAFVSFVPAVKTSPLSLSSVVNQLATLQPSNDLILNALTLQHLTKFYFSFEFAANYSFPHLSVKMPAAFLRNAGARWLPFFDILKKGSAGLSPAVFGVPAENLCALCDSVAKMPLLRALRHYPESSLCGSPQTVHKPSPTGKLTGWVELGLIR
jgi:hypothetical protein